jgi:hypothetical protein
VEREAERIDAVATTSAPTRVATSAFASAVPPAAWT